MSSYYILQHSGVKGQRWGIRRYQNPDGTLTDAGKVRYNEDGTKKNLNAMTNEDLKKANERLTAEATNKQLNSKLDGGSVARSTSLKLGVAFLASAGATFLTRKLTSKNHHWLAGKKNVKRSLVEASLAGGIGALMITPALVGSGGSVYMPPTPKVVTQKKK